MTADATSSSTATARPRPARRSPSSRRSASRRTRSTKAAPRWTTNESCRSTVYEKLRRAGPRRVAPPRCSPAPGEAAPTGRWLRYFHVNFGVPEEYAEDHLPGALFLDTNWLETASDWNRRSPAGAGSSRCAAWASPRTPRSSCTAGHRGEPERALARPACRPDRGDARGDDPALHRRGRRAAARRRLRLVGPAGNPLETATARPGAGRRVRGDDPGASGHHRRPARGEADGSRNRRARRW